MSISANQEKDPVWQAAALAISEARDQIGENFAWTSERSSAGEEIAPQPSQSQVGDTQKVEQPNENAPVLAGTASEQSPINSVRHCWVLKTIIGLTTLLTVCTAALDWQFSRDHAAPDPLSTSSVSKTAQSNPVSNNDLIRADVEPRQSTPPAPGPGQGISLTSASTSVTPSATDASVDGLLRQIARLEETLDQLRNRQSGLDRDSANLAEQLKAMREQMTRDNAAMVDRLKELEAQARDNASMAEQLKALRSQVERDNAAISERLRAGNDQAGKATAKTNEQSQKPKPLRHTTRPVSPSPQAVARPPAPRVRQGTN